MKRILTTTMMLFLSIAFSGFVHMGEASAETSGRTVAHYKVQGLNALSATKVEGTLKALPGVWDAVADWKPGNLVVEYDPAVVTTQTIESTMAALGLFTPPAGQEFLAPVIQQPLPNNTQ